MDRLVATDEEIAAAQEDEQVKALFDDATAAGMSAEEFATYRESLETARSEAHDALLFKTMAAIREARTADYQAARAIVHRETEERVNARPVWRALAMVRDKGQAGRLDRQWIVDTYGEDALSLLPKSVPPIYGERGADAQAVAELAGFTTADEMVRSLMGIEQQRRAMREAGDTRPVRAAVIDAETDAIMADRHGDPLADGSVEREARELIHNDRQGEVIATELRALARQSRSVNDPNQAPTPYEVAKRWAADRVRQGEVRDYTSRGAIEQFRRTARQAARAAERAILAGNVDEAFRQKQRQMLNTALVTEASQAAEDIQAAVERLTKVAKRRTMANVDQEYLEQAQAMLEAVELRGRSQASLDQQTSFEAWARQRERKHTFAWMK